MDKLVVCNHGINAESMHIIQELLDSTCWLEITFLIKSPIRLQLVAVALANTVQDLFRRIKPILVRFPPVYYISVCA